MHGGEGEVERLISAGRKKACSKSRGSALQVGVRTNMRWRKTETGNSLEAGPWSSGVLGEQLAQG